MILCGENANLNYEALINLLNENNVSFIGGIFPKVISGNDGFDDKVLLLPTQFDSDPLIIKGLDSGNIEIPELTFPSNTGSLFILADGLSNYISKLIYCLYKEMRSDFQVFGSGTGYSTFERKNCLFTKEGFFKDRALDEQS